MKAASRRYVLVEVEVEMAKDFPDLTDKIAGRAYTLAGVEGATAILLDSREAYLMASAQMERQQ